MLIDQRLVPDVLFNDQRYSHYANLSRDRNVKQSTFPLISALEDLGRTTHAIVTGEGSIGKSTMCEMFYARSMAKRRHCYFVRCKRFSQSDMDYLHQLRAEDYEQTVIFDSYEELPDDDAKRDFQNLVVSLKKLGVRIIITSRTDIRGVGRLSGEEEEKGPFSDFALIEICRFTKEQLLAIVPMSGRRKSGLLELLSNTMLLSMYLEMKEAGVSEGAIRGDITEADLLLHYFKMLYEQKKLNAEVCFKDLADLGMKVYNQRKERPRCVPKVIPVPFRNMITASEREINGKTIRFFDSKQVKYLNFLHGYYLKKELTELAEYGDDPDGMMGNLFQCTSHSVHSEAFYYAGQLLRREKMASEVLELLNDDDFKKTVKYENVLCLILGYTDGVATDLPNFTFYHSCMEESVNSYVPVCQRIRELRANSLESITFLRSGTPELRVIDVNNERYRSQDNCLIENESLVLGCESSRIPDDVKKIKGSAFVRCETMEELNIPDGVNQILPFAISDCPKLRRVRIGRGLRIFESNSFLHCDALEEIEIHSPFCAGGVHINYEGLGLHLRRPEATKIPLQFAIVPTTCVGYICRAAERTLMHLRVFCGISNLFFHGVGKNNVLRSLWLSENTVIGEECFKGFCNRLERIEVDKQNPRYESVQNCLIDREQNRLLLGCRNAIIPETGVLSIACHAFARCGDIEEIRIPDCVRVIEDGAFSDCEKLSVVKLNRDIAAIGKSAFSGCNVTVVYPGSWETWMQNFGDLSGVASVQCTEGKYIYVSESEAVLKSET